MAQYSLQRPWAPGPWGGSFDQFRREMDALFNRLGGGHLNADGWQGSFPAANLYETPELPSP